MFPDALYIDQGSDTPSVILDKNKNTFEIKGRSYPENAHKFYQPVLYWLKGYVKSPNEKSRFDIQLEYLNSSSTKKIAEFLIVLESLKREQFEVYWHYSPTDYIIKTKGEEFKQILRLNFILVEEN